MRKCEPHILSGNNLHYSGMLYARYDTPQWKRDYLHYARNGGKHAYEELPWPTYVKFTVRRDKNIRGQTPQLSYQSKI
jgi:hypothetical protein